MTDTPKDNKSCDDGKPCDDRKSDNNQPGKLSKQSIEQMKSNFLYGAGSKSGVGYGQPPKDSQFKKGQSGNPKGRPKKQNEQKETVLLPMVNTILDEANKSITVREGDDFAEMTVVQALVKAHIAKALKGSAYAQKHLIEVISRSQQLQADEIVEQTEDWHKYIKYWHQQMNAPRDDDEEAPELFPHPDDIVFEHGKAPRFTGPMYKEAADDMDRTCRLRDTLLMQSALENRLNKVTDDIDGQHVLTTAMFAAITINDNLPDRFKLGFGHLMVQMGAFNILTKRQLLKEAVSEENNLSSVYGPRRFRR